MCVCRDIEESALYRHGRQVVNVFSDGRMATKVAADNSAGAGSITHYWLGDTRYNTDIYNDIVAAVVADAPPDAQPFSESESDSGDE